MLGRRRAPNPGNEAYPYSFVRASGAGRGRRRPKPLLNRTEGRRSRSNLMGTRFATARPRPAVPVRAPRCGWGCQGPIRGHGGQCWLVRGGRRQEGLRMGRREQQIEHLLRRAGFGGSPNEIDFYSEIGVRGTIDLLTYYDQIPDDVDGKIGQPGYVSVTTRGTFAPHLNITDARQRWLFRMVHSERPLQEKMALFWHNHFATAYTKIAGAYDGTEATRMLAAKPAEDRDGTKGQLELFREHALGNFRDLLIAVSKDPAMLVWLDGRDNIATRPQENYAREIMELFTFGVANVVEDDVKAAARVFTGWNLHAARPERRLLLPLRVPRQPARQHDQGLHLPDLPERQRRHRRQRRAGRHRPDQRAVRPPGHRAAARAEAVGLLRQRSRRRRRSRGSTASPASTTRPATTCARWCTRSCRRRSSGIRRWCSRATRGRSSSWCGRSRRPAGPATRSTRR